MAAISSSKKQLEWQLFGKKGIFEKKDPLEKRNANVIFIWVNLWKKGMVKRLRGWKKDIETGLAERPDAAEEDPSPLATKLLSHWAHGALSAKAIQEIAHLSQLGGCSHTEIATLAKAGNYGNNPGNIHKAVMQAFLRNSAIPPGFESPVPCIDPKTSKETESTASIFLPHTMFSALAEHYPEKFHQMFCTEQLEGFWKEVEKRKDDRLRKHPLKKGANWRNRCVPLFTHGDGAEFQPRDTLLIFSFGCLLNLFSSLDSHILMGVFPKSATTAQTWQPLWCYFAWSFEALQKGVHPSKDFNGEPLEKGSPFYPMRGKPLAGGGFCATIWTIIGDQEYFSNVLKLNHWASKKPCHQCNATSKDGALPYTWLDSSLFECVNTEQALANPSSNHAIFQVAGVSSRMVRGDGLHILFTKGIYAHVLGSCLHYMCWYDPIGSVQRVKPQERLALIFSEVQKQYKLQGASTELTNLGLSMFTSEKKPHQSYAFLDAKGGECKWLAPALLAVMKKMLGTDREHHATMVSCLEALVQLVCLWDGAGVFLSEGEYELTMSLCNSFFLDYTSLHNWAADENRLLYNIVFKHHSLLHLCLDSFFLNPRFHWCFKSEDFVGAIAKMAHSCTHGVASTKLSTKVLPKYAILFHLLLTRPGFSMET